MKNCLRLSVLIAAFAIGAAPLAVAQGAKPAPKTAKPPAKSAPAAKKPVAPAVVTPAIPPPPPPPAIIEERESPMAMAARLIAVSAAIGLGIGLTALLFLQLLGIDLDEPENVFAGLLAGIVALGTFAITLVLGVVIGAIYGMHAARSSPTPTEARAVGALAGGLGHGVMIVVLGVVFVFGLPIVFPGSDEPSRAQLSCERNFGAGASICQEQTPNDEPRLQWDAVLKACIGLIPAGLTGGLTATIMYPRKRR